jgi:hypothetical protein
MQFGADGWHQWRQAEPAKKADKKHQPGDVEGAHLYALQREYIEFGKLILHCRYLLDLDICAKPIFCGLDAWALAAGGWSDLVSAGALIAVTV